MRLHKKIRPHPDFDPLPVVAPRAHVAVQTTFRHMQASPAVAARVEAEAQKLLRYFKSLTHCHVVIVAPHRHRRLGRAYSVHLELSVPKERIAITHEHGGHPPPTTRNGDRDSTESTHQDVYVVLREVFDAARRRLEDYARRRRGDVKRHRTGIGDVAPA